MVNNHTKDMVIFIYEKQKNPEHAKRAEAIVVGHPGLEPGTNRL